MILIYYNIIFMFLLYLYLHHLPIQYQGMV